MKYTYKLDIRKALNLANGITQMTEGGASSKEQRSVVLTKIRDQFPFIFDSTLKREENKEAEIQVNKRELRALAHGIIEIIAREPRIEKAGKQFVHVDGCSGEVYEFYKEIAKGTLRIWENYIKKHIKPDSAPEFEGDLDDEELTLDEEEENATS